MRLSALSFFIPLVTFLLTGPVMATKLIQSSALLTCMANSQFTASSFDVTFYPDNKTVNFDITAISTISGNVTANIEVIAYGITIINRNVNPCDISSLKQLCPISAGHFDISSSLQLSSDIVNGIPGIAFTIPDLDGVVRVTVFNEGETSNPIACVEATLTNGKTVQTKYASWGIAAVIVLGLLTSGIISIMGHQSASSHISSNTLSLFVYFQSVAIVSMMAVNRLPPMAAAWAQNFQWTMGLMRLGFMQDIFNWYVQSTGGTATNILPNKNIISIEVQKRDLTGIVPSLGNYVSDHVRRGIARNMYRSMETQMNTYLPTAQRLVLRAAAAAANTTTNDPVTGDEKDPNIAAKTLVLRGMERVAYLANIELSSLFLTGLTFFVVLGIFCVLAIAIVKGVIELLAKTGSIHPDKFASFRQGWLGISKGVLFRLVLVGFPQLSVLCLWQLTERDSPATVVLGILVYLLVLLVLGFAAFKVITIARRSLAEYKNPAYILFSDQSVLDRLGFLYIQFRATAYYFIVPLLAYTLWKACFIAFGQPSGKAQAVGVFLGELGFLVGIAWMKPYMDKTTNGFNIAIAAINFINSIFFLFFSQLFGQPPAVGSIMAVVFFVLNAAFSLILLIMIIVSCVWAIMSKNPDTRYQPMRDDRESFMKDNTGIEKKRGTELDALGVTARDGYEEGQRASVYDSEEASPSEYASKTSLPYSSTNEEAFPQARLSRKGDRPANPFGDSYENNYSSSSLDLGAGGHFPQNTTYRGYYPADESPQSSAWPQGRTQRF
ncbi:FAD transporter FLC2 [Sugiyamaella lignohabitans]|uniref:FAD transporter FLC2 n=1 Tax=Sugiyamaella lignohabitans TaxID=796027 RepID=A0A167CAB2_9ASCO|nr:FAD transporter FLC2 [Sugiyamaella lignohabitans]ANB11424.1 FAD transporter FLC2 [Sugiyamaella lignohabitans]